MYCIRCECITNIYYTSFIDGSEGYFCLGCLHKVLEERYGIKI
jgi:hypothetical protein